MEKFILFLVISFAIWIFNLLSQNKGKGQVDAGPRRPAGPPRDGRVRNEIDDFLKEIGGGGGRKIENVQDQDDDIFIEIVPEEDRTGTRQQQSTRRPVAQTPLAQPSDRERPGSAIADREGPGSTDLGEDVQQHVSDHMRAGMVEEHVQEHLDHDVNKSVRQHLGTSRRDEMIQQRADKLPTAKHKIVKLLYTPSGMRQAILLSEVLSRPKGLRRSS